jgi:hypothetical protein
LSGQPSEVRGGVHHLWICVQCGGGTDSVERDLVIGPDQADIFVGDEESVKENFREPPVSVQRLQEAIGVAIQRKWDTT